MPEKIIPVKQILTLLKENPRTIAELTAGLSAEELCTAPSEGQWAARDVLAHLRSCADVWGSCIKTILGEERPSIRAINPRTWVKSTNYRELQFQPSFDAFIEQRNRLLIILESLTSEQWLRGATVTGAGKPLDRTVHFYAQWLAKHERTHLKQFKQIANAMKE